MSLLRESASVDVLRYNTVMYALIRIITVRETVVYRFHLCAYSIRIIETVVYRFQPSSLRALSTIALRFFN
jgi:hypothetical protein